MMTPAIHPSRGPAPRQAPIGNALLFGATSLPVSPHGGSGSRGAPKRDAAPDTMRTLARSAIIQAAVLSDTPDKWASTLAMLRKNGVDPSGYEDFKKGRPLAIAGFGAPDRTAEEEGDQQS